MTIVCVYLLLKKNKLLLKKDYVIAVHPNAETFANFLEHLIFQAKNLLQTDTN